MGLPLDDILKAIAGGGGAGAQIAQSALKPRSYNVAAPATSAAARLAASFGGPKAPEPSKGPGGAFGFGLKVLDFGRGLGVSTIKEGIDFGQDVLAGRVGDGEWSPAEWWSQATNHYGFGDLIEDERNWVGGMLMLTSPFTGGVGLALGAGVLADNIWADRAIGFIGDVALDPLMYMGGFGAITRLMSATQVTQRLGRFAAMNADDMLKVGLIKSGTAAAAKPLQEAALQAANAVSKGRSVSSASRSLLKTADGKKVARYLGLDPGFRMRMPGTGPAGRLMRQDRWLNAAGKLVGRPDWIAKSQYKNLAPMFKNMFDKGEMTGAIAKMRSARRSEKMGLMEEMTTQHGATFAEAVGLASRSAVEIAIPGIVGKGARLGLGANLISKVADFPIRGAHRLPERLQQKVSANFNPQHHLRAMEKSDDPWMNVVAAHARDRQRYARGMERAAMNKVGEVQDDAIKRSAGAKVSDEDFLDFAEAHRALVKGADFDVVEAALDDTFTGAAQINRQGLWYENLPDSVKALSDEEYYFLALKAEAYSAQTSAILRDAFGEVPLAGGAKVWPAEMQVALLEGMPWRTARRLTEKSRSRFMQPRHFEDDKVTPKYDFDSYKPREGKVGGSQAHTMSWDVTGRMTPASLKNRAIGQVNEPVLVYNEAGATPGSVVDWVKDGEVQRFTGTDGSGLGGQVKRVLADPANPEAPFLVQHPDSVGLSARRQIDEVSMGAFGEKAFEGEFSVVADAWKKGMGRDIRMHEFLKRMREVFPMEQLDDYLDEIEDAFVHWENVTKFEAKQTKQAVRDKATVQGKHEVANRQQQRAAAQTEDLRSVRNPDVERAQAELDAIDAQQASYVEEMLDLEAAVRANGLELDELRRVSRKMGTKKYKEIQERSNRLVLENSEAAARLEFIKEVSRRNRAVREAYERVLRNDADLFASEIAEPLAAVRSSAEAATRWKAKYDADMVAYREAKDIYDDAVRQLDELSGGRGVAGLERAFVVATREAEGALDEAARKAWVGGDPFADQAQQDLVRLTRTEAQLEAELERLIGPEGRARFDDPLDATRTPTWRIEGTVGGELGAARATVEEAIQATGSGTTRRKGVDAANALLKAHGEKVKEIAKRLEAAKAEVEAFDKILSAKGSPASRAELARFRAYEKARAQAEVAYREEGGPRRAYEGLPDEARLDDPSVVKKGTGSFRGMEVSEDFTQTGTSRRPTGPQGPPRRLTVAETADWTEADRAAFLKGDKERGILPGVIGGDARRGDLIPAAVTSHADPKFQTKARLGSWDEAHRRLDRLTVQVKETTAARRSLGSESAPKKGSGGKPVVRLTKEGKRRAEIPAQRAALEERIARGKEKIVEAAELEGREVPVPRTGTAEEIYPLPEPFDPAKHSLRWEKVSEPGQSGRYRTEYGGFVVEMARYPGYGAAAGAPTSHYWAVELKDTPEWVRRLEMHNRGSAGNYQRTRAEAIEEVHLLLRSSIGKATKERPGLHKLDVRYGEVPAKASHWLPAAKQRVAELEQQLLSPELELKPTYQQLKATEATLKEELKAVTAVVKAQEDLASGAFRDSLPVAGGKDTLKAVREAAKDEIPRGEAKAIRAGFDRGYRTRAPSRGAKGKAVFTPEPETRIKLTAQERKKLRGLEKAVRKELAAARALEDPDYVARLDAATAVVKAGRESSDLLHRAQRTAARLEDASRRQEGAVTNADEAWRQAERAGPLVELGGVTAGGPNMGRLIATNPNDPDIGIVALGRADPTVPLKDVEGTVHLARREGDQWVLQPWKIPTRAKLKERGWQFADEAPPKGTLGKDDPLTLRLEQTQTDLRTAVVAADEARDAFDNAVETLGRPYVETGVPTYPLTPIDVTHPIVPDAERIRKLQGKGYEVGTEGHDRLQTAVGAARRYTQEEAEQLMDLQKIADDAATEATRLEKEFAAVSKRVQRAGGLRPEARAAWAAREAEQAGVAAAEGRSLAEVAEPQRPAAIEGWYSSRKEIDAVFGEDAARLDDAIANLEEMLTDASLTAVGIAKSAPEVKAMKSLINLLKGGNRQGSEFYEVAGTRVMREAGRHPEDVREARRLRALAQEQRDRVKDTTSDAVRNKAFASAAKKDKQADKLMEHSRRIRATDPLERAEDWIRNYEVLVAAEKIVGHDAFVAATKAVTATMEGRSGVAAFNEAYEKVIRQLGLEDWATSKTFTDPRQGGPGERRAVRDFVVGGQGEQRTLTIGGEQRTVDEVVARLEFGKELEAAHAKASTNLDNAKAEVVRVTKYGNDEAKRAKNNIEDIAWMEKEASDRELREWADFLETADEDQITEFRRLMQGSIQPGAEDVGFGHPAVRAARAEAQRPNRIEDAFRGKMREVEQRAIDLDRPGVDIDQSVRVGIFDLNAKERGVAQTALKDAVSKSQWGPWRLMSGDEALDRGMLDVVEAFAKINDHEDWGALWRGWNKIQTYLKSAMIATPGFVQRNIFGAFFNAWLDGVNLNEIVSSTMMTFRIAREARDKNISFLRAARGLAKSTDDANLRSYVKLLEVGVRGGGQAVSAVELGIGLRNARSMEMLVGRRTGGGKQYSVSLKPWSPRFAPYQAVRTVNSWVEDVVRLGVGMDTLRYGGSVDDALARIAKSQFDYDELTQFERKWMKSIFPFYTWTRKNVPYQLQQIMKHPSKYNKLLSAKRNLELGTESEGVVPDYFLEPFGVRLPFAAKGGTVYTAPDIPFQDLGRYDPFQRGGWKKATTTLLSSASPILKAPLEVAFGKQVFNGIPFSGRYQKAPAAISGVPFVMDALSMSGVAVRSPSGEWKMRDHHIYLITNALPTIGLIRRIFPNEPKYQRNLTRSLLSTMFGMSANFNTPEVQSNWLTSQRYDRLTQRNDRMDIISRTR